MSLPTAPLGQLANMNFPGYIPNQEKESTARKLLTAFLGNLAQNAGAQIGENITSRDYAEQPANWYQKILSGPRENRQQFEAGKQRSFTTDERIAAQQAASEEATRGRRHTTGERVGGQKFTRTENDKNRELTSAELAQRRREMDRRFNLDKNAADQTTSMLPLEVQRILANIEAAQSGVGQNNAQAEYYRSQALKENENAALRRSLLNPQKSAVEVPEKKSGGFGQTAVGRALGQNFADAGLDAKTLSSITTPAQKLIGDLGGAALTPLPVLLGKQIRQGGQQTMDLGTDVGTGLAQLVEWLEQQPVMDESRSVRTPLRIEP